MAMLPLFITLKQRGFKFQGHACLDVKKMKIMKSSSGDALARVAWFGSKLSLRTDSINMSFV